MRHGYQTQADVARRITWFILLLVGVSLMIALYYIKTRAQTARQSAAQLHYEIALEEAAIGVLRAEIAHLEDPARLQGLASEYLELAPTQTSQMIEKMDIADRFPLKAEKRSVEPVIAEPLNVESANGEGAP